MNERTNKQYKLCWTFYLLVPSYLLRAHEVPGTILGAESRTSFRAATYMVGHSYLASVLLGGVY